MFPIGLVVLMICAVSTTELNHDEPKIIPRIISGKQAEPGQFPWQVLLKQSSNDDLFCGGSIISQDWVLTAAHCVYGLKSLFIVCGTININEQPTALTSTELYYHSQYNSQNFNNDIGLVKLPISLIFSKTIQPISLLGSGDEKFVGQNGRVSGWGYMSDEDLEYSEVLLFANMKVTPNEDCKKVFGEDLVKTSTICAQGSSTMHESICSGDSGGALVVDINGRAVQIGINSFVVEDICSEGYPAGFLRVGSFLDYIENTTGIKIN